MLSDVCLVIIVVLLLYICMSRGRENMTQQEKDADDEFCRNANENTCKSSNRCSFWKKCQAGCTSAWRGAPE